MLDLTCKTVAKMITGKTPEEIRATFNIKEEQGRSEINAEKVWAEDNAWAEDKPLSIVK